MSPVIIAPSAEAFHAGEQTLQTRVGVRERMAMAGPRLLRDAMPDQHRLFFAQLPFVVVGTVDGAGQPWASALAGRPGFMQSPDARHLQIGALPGAGHPLAEVLAPGASVGLLGIEPHTRRRNRMNGVVAAVGSAGFTVQVSQSFGNCPQYIQAREPAYTSPSNQAAPQPERMRGLDARARELVASADTFFIASAHPLASQAASAEQGVDVSHRGGKPGFVRITEDAAGRQILTVPDFSGNNFFNTLGNLALEPRAGLLFIDYESGDMLSVAVTTQVVWEGPELAGFDGALRLLRCEVLGALRLPAALPLRWSAATLSPVLSHTGSWH